MIVIVALPVHLSFIIYNKCVAGRLSNLKLKTHIESWINILPCGALLIDFDPASNFH